MNSVSYDEWLGWNEPPRAVDEANKRISGLATRAECQEFMRALREIVRHNRYEEFNAIASGTIAQPRTWDAAMQHIEKLLDSNINKTPKG